MRLYSSYGLLGDSEKQAVFAYMWIDFEAEKNY
jgi:hypothetical protein